MSLTRSRLTRYHLLLPALITISGTATQGSLDKEGRRWLEEVAYIISTSERSHFETLASGPAREDFVRRFWEIRDPDTSTELNEYREEHQRRIRYVNERFHEGWPGWKSDRGRIYIMHGPPDDTHFTFGGDSLRIDIENPTEVLTAGQGTDRRRTYRLALVRPETEIWVYKRIDGARNHYTHFQVIFSRVDPQQLYSLNQIVRKIGGGRQASYPARVSRDSAIKQFQSGQRATGPFRIIYAGQYKFPDVDTFYKAIFNPNQTPSFDFFDFQTSLKDLERSPGEVLEEKIRRKARLREEVRARVSFNTFEMDILFGSVRADHGGTLLPITLGVDPRFAGDEMELLLELQRPDLSSAASLIDAFRIQQPTEEKEEPFLYQARLGARPGRYTLRVYGRLANDGSVSYNEVTVELPDYTLATMSMSDVLLFDKVVRRTSGLDRQESRFLGGSSPLRLKDYLLVPATDSLFRRREQLTAFFEVYNSGRADRETAAPALDLKCQLWSEGALVATLPEKLLNHMTESQKNGPGRRTSYGLSIPLQSLRPGHYSLKFEVRDRSSDQSVSGLREFSIR